MCVVVILLYNHDVGFLWHEVVASLHLTKEQLSRAFWIQIWHSITFPSNLSLFMGWLYFISPADLYASTAAYVKGFLQFFCFYWPILLGLTHPNLLINSPTGIWLAFSPFDTKLLARDVMFVVIIQITVNNKIISVSATYYHLIKM